MQRLEGEFGDQLVLCLDRACFAPCPAGRSKTLVFLDEQQRRRDLELSDL
jgi:hypothetical protein